MSIEIPHDQQARNNMLMEHRNKSCHKSRFVNIVKNHPEAQVPSKSNTWDAGFDIYSVEAVTILPGDRCKVPTGISMELPRGYVGLIWPRSGSAVKSGIDTLAGVIDSDYRGEVCVVLQNHGDSPYSISPGDRVAQMIIHDLPNIKMSLVAELRDTDRGHGGFGSTGV